MSIQTTAKCKKCGETIVWVKVMHNDKWVNRPMDPVPVMGGRWDIKKGLSSDQHYAQEIDRDALEDDPMHTWHWDTCSEEKRRDEPSVPIEEDLPF